MGDIPPKTDPPHVAPHCNGQGSQQSSGSPAGTDPCKPREGSSKAMGTALGSWWHSWHREGHPEWQQPVAPWSGMSCGAAVGPLWDSCGTAKLPQGARLSTGHREGTARGRRGVGTNRLGLGEHMWARKPRGNFTGENTPQMLARSGRYP